MAEPLPEPPPPAPPIPPEPEPPGKDFLVFNEAYDPTAPINDDQAAMNIRPPEEIPDIKIRPWTDEELAALNNTEPVYEPDDGPLTDNQIEQIKETTDAEKTAMREWKTAHPETTIKEQRRLKEAGVINELPWELGLQADNETVEGNVRGFGIEFPTQARKGDQFLRVDVLPTKLYKFNGIKWIEVDKNLTDQYAYNESYIDHLIEKLGSGEYDADLLSEAERAQIENRLRQNTAGE